MFIHLLCPPLPYCVIAGISEFRIGDIHEKRLLDTVFDIILVHEGELSMSVGTEHFEVRERQYLILPPNIRHGGLHHCTEQTEFFWLHFHVDGRYERSREDRADMRSHVNKNKFYHRDPFWISLSQYGTLDTHTFAMACQYMQSLSQVRVSRQSHRKTYTAGPVPVEQQSEFLNLISLLSHSRGGDKESDNLAQRVYEYLQRNSMRAVGMKELSEQFAYSPNYLSRVMRKRYGLPPVRLGIEIRLDSAKHLLAVRDDSIQSIARQTGFNNVTYFARQFKLYTGMTMTAYRSASRA